MARVEAVLQEHNWVPGSFLQHGPWVEGYVLDIVADWVGRERGEFLTINYAVYERHRRPLEKMQAQLRERGFPALLGPSTPNAKSRFCVWLLYRATPIGEGAWLLTPGAPPHLGDRVTPEVLPMKELMVDAEGALWEEDYVRA